MLNKSQQNKEILGRIVMNSNEIKSKKWVVEKKFWTGLSKA